MGLGWFWALDGVCGGDEEPIPKLDTEIPFFARLAEVSWFRKLWLGRDEEAVGE